MKYKFSTSFLLTVKELQERRLGTSGALDTSESQIVPSPPNGALVHEQIVQP